MESKKRKLPRLSGYGYSNHNYYFVTICTHEKKPIFGEVGHPNELGQIVEQELLNISSHFVGVKIDKYVIMPNHIHAIIVLGCSDEVERSRPLPIYYLSI